MLQGLAISGRSEVQGRTLLQKPQGKDSRLKKLQVLWQQKEYRAVPVSVSRYLRQHLPNGAASCWHALYESAFFCKDWSLNISIKALARELNCSSATVCRLLTFLEKRQYIVRQKNKINNVHYASKIFVRLPEEAMRVLEQAPNRRRAKKVVVRLDAHIQQRKVAGSDVASFVKNIPTDVDKETGCQAPSREGGYLKNETSNKNNINNKILINNNANNVTKNSQSVVDENEKKGKEENLKDKIKRVGDKIQNLYESCHVKANCFDERVRYFDEIKQFSAIQSALEQDLYRLERQRRTSKQHDSLHYLTASGSRPMAAHQVRRLNAGVAHLTQDEGRQKQCVNEIAFAVRFGNLRRSYLNNQEISVEYSLNIALKLLRDGRWQTPSGMKYIPNKGAP